MKIEYRCVKPGCPFVVDHVSWAHTAHAENWQLTHNDLGEHYLEHRPVRSTVAPGRPVWYPLARVAAGARRLLRRLLREAA